MTQILKSNSVVLFLCISIIVISCNEEPKTTDDSNTTASAVEPAKDWKFGVALWTFHTVNFPESLSKVDSAGLKYIEPNTFHKAGPDLKDSMISQLSPAGIAKLRSMIAAKGLTCESLYIVGDSTIKSWKKQFDIAKQLG